MVTISEYRNIIGTKLNRILGSLTMKKISTIYGDGVRRGKTKNSQWKKLFLLLVVCRLLYITILEQSNHLEDERILRDFEPRNKPGDKVDISEGSHWSRIVRR